MQKIRLNHRLIIQSLQLLFVVFIVSNKQFHYNMTQTDIFVRNERKMPVLIKSNLSKVICVNYYLDLT